METPDKPEKPIRDELSMEVSGAVDKAHVTDTFNIGEGIMQIVNTQPYPKGEHPIETMSRQTAPYPMKLRGLLINLCGGDPIIELAKEQKVGVPADHMGSDLGTAVPKDMITDKTDEEEVIPLSTSDYEFIRKKRITQPLGTGDYEVIGEGEQLVHEIAKEITYSAKMSIHSIDTEKIEVEEERVNVEEEISQYFDRRIQEALLSTQPDERLRQLFTLQALKKEICGQLIEVASENRDRYMLSIKNAINYIVDSVVVRGINKSITLEINV